MYELCTKKVPFNAHTQIQLVQKIKEGRIDPMPENYSPYVIFVISVTQHPLVQRLCPPECRITRPRVDPRQES